MKVLAITTDASIEVALSSLDSQFQVTSARDAEAALEAAYRSDVALVALGSTERGLKAVEALERLRVGIPCLVVGDVAPAVETATPVILRPFSMPELTEAMVAARRRPKPAPPPPPAAVEPPAVVEPRAVAAPSRIVEPPAVERLDVEHVPIEEVSIRPPAVEPVAAETVPPQPLAELPDVEPIVVVRDEPLAETVEPPPSPGEVEDLLRQLEAAAAAAPAAAAAAPAPPAPAGPRQDLRMPPGGDPVAWALSLLHEIGDPRVAGEPDPNAPRARTLPAGTAPVVEAATARILRHAATNPGTGAWLNERSKGTGLHRLRRRRSMSVSPAGSRQAMLRRVRTALEGARDLAALVEEIPALTRPGAMASALVREAVELLGAETAVLYACGATGPYEVAASHGLSPVEQSMAVPAEQPLFTDVANRLEAVLVAPVDLVRGLVAGVAGTNVDALMLAPLEVDGTCVGILVAGRSHFTDDDLERLWLLAEEAAPGFAAARLIERLRTPDPLPIAL